MRVATWNINGIRARLDYVCLWLQSRQPDIVGFQELKAEDHAFPHDAFHELGYVVHTHGQKAWNGVAIATKRDVVITQKGLPTREENGARLIACVADELTYITVYCPNGKSVDHADFQMKLQWFKALSDYCTTLNAHDSELLIGGDYNIVPQAVDSHRGEAGNGEIFHTTEEREVLQKLFDQGLLDVFRSIKPDSNEFSWWDYRAGAFQRNLGLRIDLLLGTQKVVDRVADVVIDRDFRKKQEGLTASDHAPVYVDLE